MNHDKQFSKKQGDDSRPYQSNGFGKKLHIVKPDKSESTPTKTENKKLEPHLGLLAKFSNANWEEMDAETSYSAFKELEKALKKLCDVSL